MVKFRRPARKRTFRKRRFTKKRSFKKRGLPKYDGMVRVKIEANKESINQAADVLGISDFFVSWGDQQTAGGTPNNIVIQDSPEWVRYRQLY